jgi:hypothetical protein
LIKLTYFYFILFVCILPGGSGVQAWAAQHQFGWILGQCQTLLNGGGPDQAVCSCDVSTGFDSCRSGKEFVVIENNCLRRIWNRTSITQRKLQWAKLPIEENIRHLQRNKAQK